MTGLRALSRLRNDLMVLVCRARERREMRSPMVIVSGQRSNSGRDWVD